MEQPDRIEVSGEHEEEQLANAVDLYMSIEGSSFFTGRAALSKAKEIAVLVEGLQQAGVGAEHVDVLSVSTTVQSGVFSKSSSAVYELRVRVESLDVYSHVLGAVSAAKQVSLHRHEWRYPNDAGYRAQLLAAATRHGTVKAKAIAEALDVKLSGVLLAEERMFVTDDAPRPQMANVMFAPRARAAAEPAELGMQVQNRRKVRCEMRLTFRIENTPR